MDSDEDSFAVEDDTSEADSDSASSSPSADETNHLEGNEADEAVEKTTENPLRRCTDFSFDSSGEGSGPEPDDDEMMAVDDQLAQLFKNRLRGKKSKGSYTPRTFIVRINECLRGGTERGRTLQEPYPRSIKHPHKEAAHEHAYHANPHSTSYSCILRREAALRKSYRTLEVADR